ncbi:protein eyes shut homolog [Ictalurus furcatus]|uniref:protein eyes shut homolog n=1 Tax=Ictalurus furcatus TaxID=66913 RepID=UPI002350A2B7|nr:protein eyes shut homolog [Ictalurus furcatus]
MRCHRIASDLSSGLHAVSFTLKTHANRSSTQDNCIGAKLFRYWLPVSKDGGLCLIEIAAANGTANRSQKYVSEPSSEVVFGPTFLGGVPFLSKLHGNIGSGIVGCIMELQVNSRELHIMEEAHRGQNIHNCDTPVCQHQPCQNGGRCIRYASTVHLLLRIVPDPSLDN